MKKLTILFALLTLSVGMWAETINGVKYIDANGQEQTADGVTEITNVSSTLAAGWYVVKGNNVTTGSLTCSGAVHLILADGAKLTATGDGNQYTPGIQVSGEGNSLTVYGQAGQTGQLIATGGNYSAGIGGGKNQSGSNIFVYGGEIVATGGFSGPGIGSGSNGTAASNIKVATRLLVKAGANANPTTVVSNNGTDLASNLAGKQFVTVGAPKHAVTYGENITVSPNFVSGSNVTVGTEITFTAADRTEAGYEFLGFYEEATFDTPITDGVSDLTYTVTVADAAIYVYAKYQQHISAAYIDAAGQEQTKDAIVVTSVATHQVIWTAGWYVVNSDITLSQGAVCQGDVRLILADGAKLTATGEYLKLTAGIHVSGIGNSLTIYGQTNQSGELIATGGGYAAGIGGKQYEKGSNISIYGGTITATGYTNVSAIGGGHESSGENIKVSTDLHIKAGESANPTEVIDNNGGDLASDLDGKQFVTIGQKPPFTVTYGDYITVTPEFASGSKVAYGTGITFTAADRWEQGCEFLGFYKENTFENQITEGVSGLTYTVTVADAAIYVYAKYQQHISAAYIDAAGQEQTADATEITNASATLAAGWYVVKGTDVQTGTLTCQGAVHIILADGAKLTANGTNSSGIQVQGDGNSLTIYAQSTGDEMGQLFATGLGDGAAGIGGEREGNGSNITINGGIVTANGGSNAAGIGGGYQGNGSNITINGGNVTATGGDNGAGIGGGSEGSGSNITINGGTVTATGLKEGAGIGGGMGGSGSNITINGGTVTANGGVNGAGIGGGMGGSGSNIKVATYLIVKAGGTENPTKEIATDRTDDTDIASSLASKQYATTEINFSKYKTFVIAAVNAEITESDNDNVKAIATNAATAINAAASFAELYAIKDFALAAIASARAAYADGLAEAAAALPTDPEGTAGHTVTITKGDKTLKLVNPDKVTYGKQE